MKKHLIAAAVATAIAVPAAAQVTVYGRFDQAYLSQKVTDSRRTAIGDTLKTTNSGLDGGVGGSRLGFRGSEDLGGGMKANFVYEFGVDAGDNAGIGSTRLGFADIGGGFGTLRYGRQVSATKSIVDAFNALGNSTSFVAGDANQSGLSGMDVRVSNAITYLSPNLGGFSFQFQYGKNEQEFYTGSISGTTFTADGKTTISPTLMNGNSAASGYGLGMEAGPFSNQQGEISGAALNYVQGPLAIGLAVHNSKVKNALILSFAGLTDAAGSGVEITETAVAELKVDRTALGASYDFGAAKVFLEHLNREEKRNSTMATDITFTTVGVTVPLGAVVLAGQFFNGKNEPGGTTRNTDHDGYKLRAAYNLSKRTSVYAQMGQSESEQSTTTVPTKIKTSGTALGLIHTF